MVLWGPVAPRGWVLSGGPDFGASDSHYAPVWRGCQREFPPHLVAVGAPTPNIQAIAQLGPQRVLRASLTATHHPGPSGASCSADRPRCRARLTARSRRGRLGEPDLAVPHERGGRVPPKLAKSEVSEASEGGRCGRPGASGLPRVLRVSGGVCSRRSGVLSSVASVVPPCGGIRNSQDSRSLAIDRRASGARAPAVGT